MASRLQKMLSEAFQREQARRKGFDDAAGPDIGLDADQPQTHQWQVGNRGTISRALDRIRNRPLKLSERTDPILLISIKAVGLALVISLLVGVYAGQTYGWFDRWSVRPLRDDRIIENVRDEMLLRPVTDAAFHEPDRSIYVSQTGGTIHVYDPATELWRTERPFSDGDLNNPDVRWLTSTPPGTTAGSTDAELWGVTEGGGLVRRQDDQWRVIISDSTFTGADGKAVNHDELSAAAASTDERWLVLGTRASGVGLYDLDRRRWLPVEASETDTAAAPVSHAFWWEDRFWIGSSTGLAQLDPLSEPRALEPFAELPGEVLDLDVKQDAGLWVLQSVSCESDGEDCRRLARLIAPDAEPLVLIDERNRYPSSDLSSFFFAEEWRGRLVLAGAGGVLSYNTRLRSWRRHFAGRVSLVTRCRNENCFYFGFNRGVGVFSEDQLEDGVPVRWTLPPGEVPAQIAVADAPGTMVVTLSGKTFSLEGDGTVRVVNDASSSDLPLASFDRAVTWDDSVLFLGRGRALLHDVANRSYRNFSNLPVWLRSPSSTITASGSTLFSFSPIGSGFSVRTLNVQQIRDGNFVPVGDPFAIDGPIRSLTEWDSGRVGLIDGLGRVAAISRSGPTYLTGTSAPEMNGARILDAADSGGMDLVIATSTGVRAYSARSRGWGEYSALPDNERPREIVFHRGQTLAISESNRLVTVGPGARTVIGGRSFGMSDAEITDVHADGAQLYFAAAGRIDRYDESARMIDRVWRFESDGPVSIKGVVDQQPVSLAGGVVRHGSDRIAQGAHDAFVQGSHVAVVIGPRGRRYLQIVWIGSEEPEAGGLTRCLFRNPTAGVEVTELRDVRQLSGDVVVATTNDGLRFYSQDHRSWYRSNLDSDVGTGALYRIGDSLVVADPADRPDRLTVLDAGIVLPDSCTSGIVRFDDVTEPEAVTGFAAHEPSNRAVWVRDDGAVMELTADGQSPLLPPPSDGPEADAVLRSWHFPDLYPESVWMTTATHIWRYEISSHTWSRLRFALETSNPVSANASTLAELDLQTTDRGIAVVAETRSGDFYSGELPSELDPGGIESTRILSLSHVFSVGTTSFSTSVENLIDVQQRRNSWVFVLSNAVKGFDPGTRTWSTLLTPRQGERIESRGLLAGNEVITGRDASGRSVWWIEQAELDSYLRYDHQDHERTALGSGSRVYRLDRRGVLRVCRADRNSAWSCTVENAPLVISPGEVRQAFGWLRTRGEYDLVLLETAAGLVAYSPTRGEQMELGADAAGFTAVSSVRQLENRLWLRSGTRVLIVERPFGREVTTRVEAGLSDLVSDNNGRVWVRFADGWRVWREVDEEFVRAQSIGQALRLFVTEGARITALDDDNVPYALDGEGVPSPGVDRLPVPVPQENVRKLIKGTSNDWWVFWEDSLGHAVPGDCAGEQEIGDSTARTTCLNIASPWPLPGPPRADIVSATPSLGNLLFTLADGSRWRTLPDGTVERVNDSGPAPRGTLVDQMVEFQGWFATLADGESAFDPIIDLASSNGNLVAVRPSGEQRVTFDSGSTDVEVLGALDTGWMRWERSARTFSLRIPGGQLWLSQRHLMDQGRFFFESFGALRVGSEDVWYGANSLGIWEFSDRELRLASGEVRLHPILSIDPVSVVGGWFRYGDTEYSLTRGGLSGRVASTSFEIESVVFEKEPRNGLLASFSAVDGRIVSAFDNERFLWDRGRRGAALVPGGVMVLSDAGMHPASALRDFDPGPPGVPSASDSLSTSSVLETFFLRSDLWYRRAQSGVWDGAGPPEPRAVEIETTNRRWTRRNGQIEIEDSQQGQNLLSANSPLRIFADELVDAASYGGRVYVMTEAFLDVMTPLDLNSPPTIIARVPASNTDRLQSFYQPGIGKQLFLSHDGRTARWNPATDTFDPVAVEDNPYRERLHAQSARLRFRSRNGRVEKQLRVEGSDGNSSWTTFNLDGNRFPFDIVRSLAVVDGDLFVGSDAGLSVYPEEALGLNDARDVFDMRTVPGSPIGRVTRVGESCDAPGTVRAWSGSSEFRRPPTGGFELLDSPARNRCRLRVQSGLWTWIDQNGTLTGRYELSGGWPGGVDRDLVPEVNLRGGRFSHDQITETKASGSTIFTVWNGNIVGVHPTGNLGLASVRNYAFAGPATLIAVNDRIPLGDDPGQELPQGMYVRERGRTWRYADAAGWIRVEREDHIRTLADYVARPPVFQRNRLRLRHSPGPGTFAFEFRMPGSGWTRMSWHNSGRLSVDVWRRLGYHDGVWWAATPDSMVALDGGGGPDPRLNPDTFRLVAVPGARMGDITDFAIEGDEALIRYNTDSTRVYSVTLDQSLQQPTPFSLRPRPDPFAEAELRTDTRYWQWRMGGRRDGSAGRLEGQWKGEPLQMSAGRFDLDVVNSIALFDDRLNLSSSLRGWFQSPLASASLGDAFRPSYGGIDPLDVVRVDATSEDDQDHLCLTGADGVTRLSAAGSVVRTQDCSIVLADAGFWRYRWDSGGLSVVPSEAGGGAGSRTLREGRFSDDVVIGVPVSSVEQTSRFTLLPTDAGIMQLDESFTPIRIFGPPFEGMPEGQTPQAIYLPASTEKSAPVYFADGGLVELEPPQVRRYPWTLELAPSAIVDRIADGPEGTVQFAWSVGNVRHTSLVDPNDAAVRLDDSVLVELRDLPEYVWRRGTGVPEGRLTLQVNSGFVAVATGATQVSTVDTADGFDVLEAIRWKTRVFLIGRREFFELNLEHIARQAQVR